MSEDFYSIYDRAAKRCLSISHKGTLLLINGLFETDYPLDSAVTYHWTEHHDEDLRRNNTS